MHMGNSIYLVNKLITIQLCFFFEKYHIIKLTLFTGGSGAWTLDHIKVLKMV